MEEQKGRRKQNKIKKRGKAVESHQGGLVQPKRHVSCPKWRFKEVLIADLPNSYIS